MTMQPADVQVMSLSQLLGTFEQLGLARRGSFGHFTRSFPPCEVTDPRRGVSCALVLDHKGDHESIGGFPFSRTTIDPSSNPSNADVDAARSMLREAGIHADWDSGRPVAPIHDIHEDGPNEGLPERRYPTCDDCGLRNGIHDPEVDH